MKKIGLVLAGGKSTRMGRDKAMLKIGGRTLLENQVALLKSIDSIDAVYVSGSYPGYDCIVDIVPHAGPLGGIASVLERFERDDVLLCILPVDMPLLDGVVLNRLMEAATKAPAFDACRFGGFEMPLVVRNSTAFCEAVDFLLSQEERKSLVSIRNVLSKVKTLEIQLLKGEENRFENLNSRFEFEKVASNECQVVE